MLIIVSSLFFSLEFSILKYTLRQYPDVDKVNLLLWGFLGVSVITSPVYFLHSGLRHKIIVTTREHGKFLPIIISLNTVALYYWLQGLAKSSLGSFTLLVKSSILFSLVLGALFLKERLNRGEVLGFTISILGLYLLSTIPGDFPANTVYQILLASFLFSMQTFMLKKFTPGIDGKSYTYLRSWLLGIMFLIYQVFVGELQILPLLLIAMSIFIFGIGVILARTLQIDAMPYLSISHLYLFALVEPSVSIISSSIFFNEQMPFDKILGIVCVFCGLVLVFIMKAKESIDGSRNSGKNKPEN